jgi:microcystin-dependent protein
MSEPYVGQIILFGGTFAPLNYAQCNGQLMAISQFEVLYTLIGTTYGGDGVNTFALPDLRGRVPVHMGTLNGGSTYVEGQRAGVETVTLNTNQIPTHNHAVLANPATGTQASPANAVLAGGTSTARYDSTTPQTALSNQSVQIVGGSQPHENMQPFQCLTFCIALSGVFPSRN